MFLLFSTCTVVPYSNSSPKVRVRVNSANSSSVKFLTSCGIPWTCSVNICPSDLLGLPSFKALNASLCMSVNFPLVVSILNPGVV